MREEGNIDTETRTDGFTALEDGFAGYTVYDSNHEKMGKVDDLFMDANDRPEYIGVKMGFLDTHSTLIPFEMATVDEERKTIVLSTDKQTAKNGPSFDDDREITPEFENEVYSYYGFQRPSTIEQSGTYAAQSAEQSTQTTGRIKQAGGTKDNVTTSWTKPPGEAGAGETTARRPPPRKWGSLAPGESRRMSETSGPSPKIVASRKIANPRNLGWGPKGLRPSTCPYSPNLVEGGFSVVRRHAVLRSSI